MTTNNVSDLSANAGVIAPGRSTPFIVPGTGSSPQGGGKESDPRPSLTRMTDQDIEITHEDAVAEIGAALGIAGSTVKNSLILIRARTGAVNRAELAAVFARWEAAA